MVMDVILRAGDEVLGFLDDDAEKKDIWGIPRLGRLAEWFAFTKEALFITAIGSGEVRRRLAETAAVSWHTAIHPSALIGRDVEIGEGSVIMAGAVINSGSRIGRHCIVNTGAVVEHDNRIGDYVHLSPHATLCGTVTVEQMTHIGAGATVKNNLIICEKTVVGAGAAVVRNIEEPGTYVGVPARRIK